MVEGERVWLVKGVGVEEVDAVPGHVPVVLDEVNGVDGGRAEGAVAEGLEGGGEGVRVTEGAVEAGGGHMGGGDTVAAVEVVAEADGLDGSAEGSTQVLKLGTGGIALDEDGSGGGGEPVKIEHEGRCGGKHFVDRAAVERKLG